VATTVITKEDTTSTKPTNADAIIVITGKDTTLSEPTNADAAIVDDPVTSADDPVTSADEPATSADELPTPPEDKASNHASDELALTSIAKLVLSVVIVVFF